MIELPAVAIACTPFKQKFGIPRQSNLVPVPARIELLPPFDTASAIDGLEGVSHLWLISQFHQHKSAEPKARVRPPRLGGNERVGVFATRSSFRPNGLGLSLVRLLDVKIVKKSVSLLVEGIDLLDQTPIVDIKPYLPYADAAFQAIHPFAQEAPQDVLRVSWSEHALMSAKDQAVTYAQQALISKLVALDPRPAYKRAEAKGRFAFVYDQWDIHVEVEDNRAVVVAVKKP